MQLILRSLSNTSIFLNSIYVLWAATGLRPSAQSLPPPFRFVTSCNLGPIVTWSFFPFVKSFGIRKASFYLEKGLIKIHHHQEIYLKDGFIYFVLRRRIFAFENALDDSRAIHIISPVDAKYAGLQSWTFRGLLAVTGGGD